MQQRRPRPTRVSCFACGWYDHPDGVRVYQYTLKRSHWSFEDHHSRTIHMGSMAICDRCVGEAHRRSANGAERGSTRVARRAPSVVDP